MRLPLISLDGLTTPLDIECTGISVLLTRPCNEDNSSPYPPVFQPFHPHFPAHDEQLYSVSSLLTVLLVSNLFGMTYKLIDTLLVLT